MITPGSSGDNYSYGVYTGDFRGTPAEATAGSTHPENGIREWAVKEDPVTGDRIFVNRGFYAYQTNAIGSNAGEAIGEYSRGTKVDIAQQIAMTRLQSTIWESQQRDIVRHLKDQYNVTNTTTDNKSFNLKMGLADGNTNTMSDQDFDLTFRNSVKLNTGAPFVDDIPFESNSPEQPVVSQ